MSRRYLSTERYPGPLQKPVLPCQTPGCSARCAYAYSCHERRMGRFDAPRWPLMGLALFAALAALGLAL